MEPIIPRWEWRTFGQRFGRADDVFAALAPTGSQESDELYLLSGAGDNVKVRDDLMDIKVLVEVDRNGLEQWRPVMKAPFPLPAALAGLVFDALHLPTPVLDRDTYTLDQFVTEVAVPGGALRAVPVHKRRVRYIVEGCSAEVSNVIADGRTTRTIAIESEDPAAVIAGVRSVGLGDYLNTSYPMGLAALLDGARPRYAVIDVGTNSIKFHVAEHADDGRWRRVVDRAVVTRLGAGLHETGEISLEAVQRAVAAISGMVEEARRCGAVAIAAVGTAGMRIARNSDAVVAAIAESTGVTVEVISGDEEGRLAYLAVQEGLGVPDGKLVVLDTGGGSTQFTFGHGRIVDDRFSLDVGAVRLTERFGMAGTVSLPVLEEAYATISAELSRLDGRTAPDALVGMGGAITNMTAVKLGMATYDPDVVQGAVLDRSEVDRQIELYRSRGGDDRRTIVGLQPNRADVILAGACVIRTVMDRLGMQALTVSDRGVRHGLLTERFGRG
jgi:exopolyphosphatase/guanosine-5'-triphosphate,3'-diphosphate pyrophosphatase